MDFGYDWWKGNPERLPMVRSEERSRFAPAGFQQKVTHRGGEGIGRLAFDDIFKLDLWRGWIFVPLTECKTPSNIQSSKQPTNNERQPVNKVCAIIVNTVYYYKCSRKYKEEWRWFRSDDRYQQSMYITTSCVKASKKAFSGQSGIQECRPTATTQKTTTPRLVENEADGGISTNSKTATIKTTPMAQSLHWSSSLSNPSMRSPTSNPENKQHIQ